MNGPTYPVEHDEQALNTANAHFLDKLSLAYKACLHLGRGCAVIESIDPNYAQPLIIMDAKPDAVIQGITDLIVSHLNKTDERITQATYEGCTVQWPTPIPLTGGNHAH